MASSNQMLALLGLLAVAGWQNRDKLQNILGNITGQRDNRPESLPPGGTTGRSQAEYLPPGGRGGDQLPSNGRSSGGFGDVLGGLFGGGAAAAGGGIGGALNDLLGQFSSRGHRQEAESWITTGPNQALGPTQLEEALGEDTIAELARTTGLSRQELLKRLSTVLPDAVDKLTPEGRLPTHEEEARWARAARAA